MSETDAIGAFATAGLVAREMDKAPGAHAAHAGVKHNECPNCGTPAPGHYCPECGQHVHVHRSVTHVLHELVHGVLHLDGKFWRTLPMLAFKPGQLTRDYIEGKRARYVAPFAIFLFTVFAMYFTFAVFGAPGDETTGMLDDGMVVDGEAMGDMTPAERNEALADMRADLADMQAERDGLAAQIEVEDDPAALRDLRSELKTADFSMRSLRRGIAGVETGKIDIGGQLGDTIGMAAGAAVDDAVPIPQAKGEDVARADADADEEGSSDEASSAVVSQSADAEDDDAGADPDLELDVSSEPEGFRMTDMQTGVPWLDKRLNHVFEDQDFFWYKVKQSAYKFSFLLLPLSLPFVWLLFFWRRDIRLYDHTVFILYSLSFMSLLTIILWVGMSLGVWGWAIFWIALTFIPPIHMYKQLKYGYQLGRIGALVRTTFLTNFALVALSLFFMLVVTLGAL